MDKPAVPAEALKTALDRFDLEVVAELGRRVARSVSSESALGA